MKVNLTRCLPILSTMSLRKRIIQLTGMISITAVISVMGTTANANQIIEKIGNTCPSNFYGSGNFCKAINSNVKHTIPNPTGGGCPGNYHHSGRYYCKSVQ